MTPSRGRAPDPMKRQQNFRLPADLVGRVEAAVAAGRVPDKSAAVVEALWLWLSPGGEEMLRAAAAAGMSLERIAEVRDEEAAMIGDAERLLVEALPEGYEPLPADVDGPCLVTVANAAGVGTVLRVSNLGDPFEPGHLLGTDEGELIAVRDVDGSLLYVDRGVGGSASAIRVGDRVTVVGREVSGASPGDDRAGSEAAEGNGGGAGANSGLEGAATPAGLPKRTAPGERGAEPAPAAQDGQAAGPPGEPAPSHISAAVWLAGRFGKPLALAQRWVATGRVTVDGEPLGGPFLARDRVELVELDGKRVL